MRSLIGMLLLSLTHLAFGQMDACVPTLLPAAENLVQLESTHCGVRMQTSLQSGNELRGGITIGVDANDGIRILQGSGEPPRAWVLGSASHAGRDGDSIYWGIWHAGGFRLVASDKITLDELGRAMPYVGGVASRSLPTGVVEYRLVGAPFIVSTYNSASAPVANADNRSNPIDPGPISRADLRVDFNAGTAKLQLRFSVRGVASDAVFEFKRRKFPSLEFEAEDCHNVVICSTARLNFYGVGATHAGVLLTVPYDHVMPEADRVAANLNNVLGTAAVALERKN
jgi:hypothetical protein